MAQRCLAGCGDRDLACTCLFKHGSWGQAPAWGSVPERWCFFPICLCWWLGGRKHKTHIKVWYRPKATCHYMSVWASYLPSPNLRFLAYKMRTVIPYFTEWFKNLEGKMCDKSLVQHLARRWCLNMGHVLITLKTIKCYKILKCKILYSGADR